MKKTLLLIIITAFAKFTVAQLAWLKLQDYPGSGKHAPSSFTINGKGYVGMGMDASLGHYNDFWEFDPATNNWTQKSPIPGIGRSATFCLVINDIGYVIGGQNGSVGGLATVYAYDPTNDTWTQKANFPTIRQAMGGFVINDKGYVGTGYASGNCFDDFYEYDPVADTWTAKANYPGGQRQGCDAFAINGKGYMGIGALNNSTGFPSDFYEYDPTTDTWTQKASFPMAYDPSVDFTSGVNGYVVAGYNHQWGASEIEMNYMNLIFKYDQPSDSWTWLGSFPGLPRTHSIGWLIGNDMYFGLGGGIDIYSYQTDFWKLANGTSMRVTEAGELNDFLIAPNIVTTTLTLPEINNEMIRSARIYDLSGKLVSIKNPGAGESNIDISDLRNGLYFIEAVTKDKVYDSRFIKQ